MANHSHLGSWYDDLYNEAAGAAATVTNDIESAGRWVGQEFEDLGTSSVQAYSPDNQTLPDAIGTSASAAASSVENAVSGAFSGIGSDVEMILVFGLGFIILLHVLDKK